MPTKENELNAAFTQTLLHIMDVTNAVKLNAAMELLVKRCKIDPESEHHLYFASGYSKTINGKKRTFHLTDRKDLVITHKAEIDDIEVNYSSVIVGSDCAAHIKQTNGFICLGYKGEVLNIPSFTLYSLATSYDDDITASSLVDFFGIEDFYENLQHLNLEKILTILTISSAYIEKNRKTIQ